MLTVSSIYTIDIVLGGTVQNLVVTPGAVNCIFQFNCTDSTDTIQIRYAKHSGITTSDNASYIDPTQITNGSREHRFMVIWALNESTLYYYRIYSTKTSTWASDEGSFTTDDRFIAQWKDEFFDTFLVSQSSGVGIRQIAGSKYSLNPVISTSAGNGWHLRDILRYWDNNTQDLIDNKYILYTNNISDNYKVVYFTSSNLNTWAGPYDVTGAEQRPCSNVMNKSGNFIMFTGAQVVSYYQNCSTYNGYFDAQAGIITISAGKELGMDNAFNDTLGGEMYFTAGQNRPDGGSNSRYNGKRYGMSNVDWIDMGDETGETYFLNLNQPRFWWNGKYLQNYASGSIQIRSGCYVAFENYYADTSTPGNDDRAPVFLMVSRDQQNYSFVNNLTPIIPLGEPYGNWEFGMVYPDYAGLMTVGELEYMFYSGYNHYHDEGDYRIAIGYMTWRKDGITSIKPNGASGYFVTTDIPSKFVNNFTINGNFSSSYQLNISVLNATTNLPYTGFDFSDFTSITSNNTSIIPQWGIKTLKNIPEGTFKLNFSFSGEGSELYSYLMDVGTHEPYSDIIQFISINGGSNGTIIYNSTPTFNWSKVSGASKYELQISNTSSFGESDLVVNLTNINQYTYPSNYSVIGSNVIFIIPIENKLVVYKTYYCRVRAYAT
jgi:hypothetical protein